LFLDTCASPDFALPKSKYSGSVLILEEKKLLNLLRLLTTRNSRAVIGGGKCGKRWWIWVSKCLPGIGVSGIGQFNSPEVGKSELSGRVKC